MRLPRLVLLVVAVLAGCGTSETATTTTSSTTTTTTTVPAECPSFGATDGTAGPAAVTREPAVALLRNVQVQSSACVDEVAFLFMGGRPGWQVAYHDGPLTEDPSGRPVAVAGAAHLVVRFEPASGVDLAGDRAIETYDGPTVIRPPAPSEVTAVHRLGDFEAVTTWAIGLGERQPFEVVTRPEQLVVRLPAAAPRPARCRVPGTTVSIGYPPGWYAELSDRWACRFFDPAPFEVHPATNDFRWLVTVDLADVGATAYLERLRGGTSTATMSETDVAGRPATVVDVTERGEGLYPAGFRSRLYVVDIGPRALVLMSEAAAPGAGLERALDAVDRMATLVQWES